MTTAGAWRPGFRRRGTTRRCRSGVASRRRSTWLAIAVVSMAATRAWWFVTGPAGLVSPLFLPPPLEVWEALVRLFSRRYLGSTLGQHVLPACRSSSAAGSSLA